VWAVGWLVVEIFRHRTWWLFDSGRPLWELARPTTVGDYGLLVLMSCANGFAEELVMRGYLLPRFERVLGSTWSAVGLTSLLFASYHIYQGLFGATQVLVFGLVYGAVFCWFRRLWPLAIAHAIADFVGILP
jgi:membrane protease YdiL (CAAX protease family)